MTMAQRVADRFRLSMPTMFRALGFNWGWYSREDPRMHIQVVGGQKGSQPSFWLESRGTRVFEPRDKETERLPAKDRDTILSMVRLNSEKIESHWESFMISKGWVKVQLDGPELKVTAYPGKPEAFTRTLDLQRVYPGIYEEGRSFDPRGLKLDPDIGIILRADEPPEKQEYFSLGDILWKGTR